MSLIFRIVFFGLIACSFLVNVCQVRKSVSRKMDFSLHVIIDYLTDLQSYIRQQEIQSTQFNFCNEHCKVVEVKNNSDLGSYEHECPRHRYITRLIERSPLIIYIEQFLTENEIQHLIDLV